MSSEVVELFPDGPPPGSTCGYKRKTSAQKPGWRVVLVGSQCGYPLYLVDIPDHLRITLPRCAADLIDWGALRKQRPELWPTPPSAAATSPDSPPST